MLPLSIHVIVLLFQAGTFEHTHTWKFTSLSLTQMYSVDLEIQLTTVRSQTQISNVVTPYWLVEQSEAVMPILHHFSAYRFSIDIYQIDSF